MTNSNNPVNLKKVWSLTGNAGTSSVNFIGTTDAQPLIIKTNNIERARFSENGNLGIGTTAPLNNLHISTPFVANTAGIRAGITSASPATTETAYLAVNAVGDIVRGAAITGGGGNSLPVSEAQVSNSIAFGKIVSGVKEFTIALNGSNQLTVTRRHSATASTFYFFNNWAGDAITTGKISRSQGTLPLNTAVVVSFDGNGGAARALANNTSVSVILYGDGQVIDVQAWNTGGGIMIRASQVI